MKKILKKIIFILIVSALILGVGVVWKIGKFQKIEGYMYSLAAEITGTSTDCNATSCNATSSNATSSNATSSNATSSNATSSNATSSNATSSNATSCNATSNIKVINDSSEKELNIETAPIKMEKKNDLKVNNSEVSNRLIAEDIKKEDNIIINIDSNREVDKKVFDEIKGKDIQLTINYENNQIIFNGQDIVEPKTIDATITVYDIKNDIDLNEIGNNGIVINFADNGELPGVATIRIKTTSEMKEVLDLDTIYVYYYNEQNKELIKLSNKAVYNDGYIEFSIKHNSKYLLVNEEITDDNANVEVMEDTVTFLESKKMYILIIVLSIIAIITVVIIVIIDKKQRTK